MPLRMDQHEFLLGKDFPIGLFPARGNHRIPRIVDDTGVLLQFPENLFADAGDFMDRFAGHFVFESIFPRIGNLARSDMKFHFFVESTVINQITDVSFAVIFPYLRKFLDFRKLCRHV